MNGLTEVAAGGLLDQLGTLGDVTRVRILLAVEQHELTVAELCSVLQAPQSTVSRHLKTLADGDWVVSRAEGTSRLYAAAEVVAPSARRLWHLVRQEMAATSTAHDDGRRLQSVLAARRTQSQQFFQTSAGQWDQLRDQLFGKQVTATALLGLFDSSWHVADLGCGAGTLAATLAPWVERVIGIDESAAMAQAARRRVRGFDNVEIRRGRLERLPLDDESLDAATCVLVLHHVAQPVAALCEAVRALRSGGRLLVADMLPHDRESFRRQMGHMWLGFSEKQLAGYFADAGLAAMRFSELAPDPHASGPGLFVATARKP